MLAVWCYALPDFAICISIFCSLSGLGLFSMRVAGLSNCIVASASLRALLDSIGCRVQRLWFRRQKQASGFGFRHFAFVLDAHPASSAATRR